MIYIVSKHLFEAQNLGLQSSDVTADGSPPVRLRKPVPIADDRPKNEVLPIFAITQAAINVRHPAKLERIKGRQRLTECEVDALDLLTQMHEAIKQLFNDYERLLNYSGKQLRKAEIVGKICEQLNLLAQIKDEVFYPAIRAAIGRNAFLTAASCDAVVSQGRGKALIAMLDEMEQGAADYDATVNLLHSYLVLRMNYEQDELFPRVRMSRLDTVALGNQILKRRKALQEDVTSGGLVRSIVGPAARSPLQAAEYVGDISEFGISPTLFE